MIRNAYEGLAAVIKYIKRAKLVEGIQKPNFASLLALSSQNTSAPSKYFKNVRKVKYTSALVFKYFYVRNLQEAYKTKSEQA